MKKSTLFILIGFYISCQGQQDVSFREDFDDNSKNWTTKNNENYESKVEDGYYYIKHKKESGSWFFWKSIVVDPGRDFIIESRITQKEGGKNNGYGLLWGTKNVKNSFIFAISSNGYFKVAKYYNGTYSDIQKWKKINNVNSIGTPNVLKIKKTGDEIYFFVNDIEVFSTEFQMFHGPKFGYILYKKMKIAIDYLEVKQDGMQLNLVEDPIQGFKKENLGENINSEVDEIFPVISPDGKTLYVCRKKHPENLGSEKKDDIWYAHRREDGSWSEVKNIGKPLNNSGHNAVISVSPDGNTLLLMNTYYEDGRSKSRGISISNKSSSGWEVPKEIKIENHYNRDTHIEYCLSSNKKILLLAVERDDSYGGRDIYFSFKKGDKFTEPKNLGPKVNSFAKEMSPFLASDNTTLYYSSNGKPGYGGNDIFMSKRLDDTWENWSEPKNLGPEINTPHWDAYFSIPASGEYAYLVSEVNSIGEADIFRIKQPESARPDPVVLIYGKVLNAKTEKSMQASILYNDLLSDEEIGTALSDPINGDYKIVLQYGRKYSFRASQEGYYPISDNIDVSDITEYQEIKRDLYLSPLEIGETIRLNNIFFDFNKSNLKEESFSELNRLMTLLNESPEMKIEISGHTDSLGSSAYNLRLSNERVNSVIQYLLSTDILMKQISGKGYGETRPVSTNETEEGRALNRRVEFTIVEMK